MLSSGYNLLPLVRLLVLGTILFGGEVIYLDLKDS
jgi:hypothetical protein